MANFIVILIISLIIFAAIAKIISEKKKGVKCVGCASSEGCSISETGNSNCNTSK